MQCQFHDKSSKQSLLLSVSKVYPDIRQQLTTGLLTETKDTKKWWFYETQNEFHANKHTALPQTYTNTQTDPGLFRMCILCYLVIRCCFRVLKLSDLFIKNSYFPVPLLQNLQKGGDYIMAPLNTNITLILGLQLWETVFNCLFCTFYN